MKHQVELCKICNKIFDGNISPQSLRHILKYQVSTGYVQIALGLDGKKRYSLTKKGIARVQERFWFLPEVKEKKPE